VDEEALAACGAAPERSAVPTLSELGYDELSEAERAFVPGGESEALRRLELTVSAPTRRAWVARFSKPDTSPTAFEPPSTTVLSPYMTHGCLSARRFWHAVADATRAAGAKGATRPPVSLHGQLLWREFFYLHSAHTPNFDRMVGNPLCRQIPWGAGDEYERRLRAWREARTGYPFIDAAMTQLRTQGWLHHLARHAVACFLTRGDLWVHWERGRDVFNEWLLDGDWALNNGNWMWLSASAFFHQYFRVYSPVAFPKRYDPSGRYVRRFLPQLRGLPDEFIYEPWKAPLSVQQRAGCVVGRDYPAPIVEHDSASRENMAKMKRAYDASKGVAAPSRAPKHAEPADEQDAAPRKRSRR
jgi:cryptochrome